MLAAYWLVDANAGLRRGLAVASCAALLVGCGQSGPARSAPSTNSQVGTRSSGVTEMSPQRAAWQGWLKEIQSCMSDRGWVLTILPDSEGPGLEGNTPEGQRDAMTADMRDCRADVGDHPFTEMSTNLATKQYAEIVSRRECLAGLGLDVQQPPSEQLWVAKQLAQDPANIPWDPYDDLPAADHDTWQQATSKCPQGGLWDFN